MSAEIEDLIRLALEAQPDVPESAVNELRQMRPWRAERYLAILLAALTEKPANLENITKKCGVTTDNARGRVSYLRKIGWRIVWDSKGESVIKRRAERRLKHEQLTRQRAEVAISFLAELGTYSAVAKKLGLHQSSISRLLDGVLPPPGWTSVEQLAAKLGKKKGSILYAANKLQLKGRYLHGEHYYLEEEVGEICSILPRKHRTRTCLLEGCGKEFAPKTNKSRFCSKNCRVRYDTRKAHAKGYYTEPPKPSEVTGWYKTLAMLRLGRPSATETDQEEWLTLSEAKRLTGLSSVIILWLAHRHLISTQPHPTRLWHGRPQTTYSRSDLLLAKQAFEQFHANNPG